ncbi:MAG: PAS domain S-box protein [Bacteroidota bacterium]
MLGFFGLATVASGLSYAFVDDPSVPIFTSISCLIINSAIVSMIVYAALRAKRGLVEQQQTLLNQRQALDDSQRIGQIGSWTFDTAAKAVDFSDEARRIFGFSLTEEVTYRKFLRRLDRASFTALRRAAILTVHRQPSYTLQQPLHLPSGETRWLEYTGQRVTIDGRKELRGTVRDITVQKAQEEKLEDYQQHLETLVRERTHELEQQKARYELINRVTTDLIAVHDPAGKYLYVSPSAHEITGYEAEDLIGRTPFEFVREGDVEAAVRAFENADPTQPITYTSPLRRKDGALIWLETVARIVFDAKGTMQEIVTISRDVTARYQEREDLKAQHQADQNTLRRNIVTTLPHELRTPLSAIIGFTSVLQYDWQSLTASEVDELLTEVQIASDRMESLIEKYTLYAYLIMATPETIEAPSVTTHAQEVVGKIRLAAERRAQMEGRGNDLHLNVVADFPSIALPYLSRITDEVVSNALKFSAPGTDIHVVGGAEDGMYTLTISDQGRGFPSGTRDKIGAFMQFERDHYEQQGAGLGLAIVKQLLRLYGGHWDIQSTPSGTTLSIHLPLMPFAIARRAEPVAERLAS